MELLSGIVIGVMLSFMGRRFYVMFIKKETPKSTPGGDGILVGEGDDPEKPKPLR